MEGVYSSSASSSDPEEMKDEAFSISEQWSLLYPPESEQRNFLESVRRERWLVSIMHHNFKDPTALWSFLEQ